MKIEAWLAFTLLGNLILLNGRHVPVLGVFLVEDTARYVNASHQGVETEDGKAGIRSAGPIEGLLPTDCKGWFGRGEFPGKSLNGLGTDACQTRYGLRTVLTEDQLFVGFEPFRPLLYKSCVI